MQRKMRPLPIWGPALRLSQRAPPRARASPAAAAAPALSSPPLAAATAAPVFGVRRTVPLMVAGLAVGPFSLAVLSLLQHLLVHML